MVHRHQSVGEETMIIPERTIDLWRHRLVHHTSDKPYRGRGLQKFPEDLRVYQTLIEEQQPEVIVEVGTKDGGSALWFADQLRALTGGGHVITIDIDPVRPLEDLDVTAIHGDATHPATLDQVNTLVAGSTCMVVEDSAHTYPTTKAVLDMYAPFVTPGQWFVVEDGVVDVEELRINPHWPRGVTPAIVDFLSSPAGGDFTRHWLDQYIITGHPGGWLQRTTPPA